MPPAHPKRRFPPPAHPARLQMIAAGKTNQNFADWSGLNHHYVCDVLNSRFPASARFRKLLSTYMGQPESTLFPEIKEPAVGATGSNSRVGVLHAHTDLIT